MSTNINKMAQNAIYAIQLGKIRNHKLVDHARIHTGEVENKGCQNYRDFLPSKNCQFIYKLSGNENY